MQYEVSIEIAAPPETVWAPLADVRRWPEWTPTMTSVEPLDGELQVGRRFRLKQPKTPSSVWQVAELQYGESFVWTTRIAGGRMVAGHMVLPSRVTASGSTLTLDIEYTGGMSGLLTAFIGNRIRGYVDTEAASLKAHCESTG